MPGTNFKPNMTERQLAEAAFADLLDQEDYIVRADALLRSCSKAQP